MSRNFEIQNALISKRRMLLSWKVVTSYKLVPLMPDEDKTFGDFLVLDLRICWRHVHTLNHFGQIYRAQYGAVMLGFCYKQAQQHTARDGPAARRPGGPETQPDFLQLFCPVFKSTRMLRSASGLSVQNGRRWVRIRLPLIIWILVSVCCTLLR